MSRAQWSAVVGMVFESFACHVFTARGFCDISASVHPSHCGMMCASESLQALAHHRGGLPLASACALRWAREFSKAARNGIALRLPGAAVPAATAPEYIRASLRASSVVIAGQLPSVLNTDDR